MMNVGDRYFARASGTNVARGISAGKSVWITHLGAGGVSIIVPLAGRDLEFLVPHDAFDANFDPDRGAYPNGKALYGRHSPATTAYR